MDLVNITFVGLMTVGFVNVVTMVKPDLDPKLKIMLSVLFSFGMAFVPAEFASVVLEKAKIAIQATLAATGTYKLAQKAGGM